jgi:hypothetical protein
MTLINFHGTSIWYISKSWRRLIGQIHNHSMPIEFSLSTTVVNWILDIPIRQLSVSCVLHSFIYKMELLKRFTLQRAGYPSRCKTNKFQSTYLWLTRILKGMCCSHQNLCCIYPPRRRHLSHLYHFLQKSNSPQLLPQLETSLSQR